MVRFTALVVSVLALVPAVLANSYTDYDNDFLDLSCILAKKFDPSTEQSIIEWVDWLAAQGLWCEVYCHLDVWGARTESC